MSAVDPSPPISWTPTDIKGEVDSKGEAIQEYLNDNPDIDLNDLSKEELDGLIAHLQKYSGQPWASSAGLPDLIKDLKGISGTWSDSKGSGKLDKLEHDLENRLSTLKTLAENTEGKDGLDKAVESTEKQHEAVSSASESASKTTSTWSKDGNKGTVEDVDNTLDELERLEDMGYDLEDLGLADLKTNLEAAKTAYEKAMKGDPSEEEKKLALSDFREAVSTAKLSYLKSTGLSDKDPAVVAEKKALDGEEIWQSHLRTKETHDGVLEIPGPEGFSPEELADYKVALEQQYEMAVASGDTDAQQMIQGKLDIVDRAIDKLAAGEEQFSTGVNFFAELKAADHAYLTVLENKARTSGNAELADSLQQQIESNTKLVEALMTEYQGIMAKISDVVSNAFQGAFQ